VLALALVGRSVTTANLDRVSEANQRARLASEQPARIHDIGDAALRLDLAASEGDPTAVDEAAARLTQEADVLRGAQRALLAGDPALGVAEGPIGDPQLTELFLGSGRLDQRLSSYASSAQLLANSRSDDEAGARQEALAVLAEAEEDLVTDLETAIRLLNRQVASAVEDQRRAEGQLLVAAVGLVALCGLVLFRPMARSISVETSALEEAERRHRESNERQTFRTELSHALELCTEEPEVLATAERALADILADRPADLLLVDAARSRLHLAGGHPLVGPAGCPVETAEACAALRSGQTRHYPSSRQLDVCPKLPQHDSAPCSAVCIPMVFNGDAVGVLHTTGPDLELPDDTVRERLQVLGEETSTRLGTLRITTTTRRLAERDALTDLDNRRTLLDKAATLVESGRPYSVAVADLDRFKDLNDTYGHEMGDRALQLFAECLRGSLRPEDVVARYGGEEFVVVLPGAGIHDATRAIERLQEALAEEIRLHHGVRFTASWGLTDSSSGHTFQEVLNVADQAMYEAKRAGRNCLVVDGDAALRAARDASRAATDDEDGAEPVTGVAPGSTEDAGPDPASPPPAAEAPVAEAPPGG
jgi:diguanylate cyclase (GGDEF)-like protein